MLKGYAGSAFYISPEVLRGTYSQPVDVWSLGVILYVLLSQKLPFWSESDAGVYRQILRGEYDLAGGPWASISSGAKSLVQQMLTLDPAQRISLDDVIGEPKRTLLTVHQKQCSFAPTRPTLYESCTQGWHSLCTELLNGFWYKL